MSISLLLIAIAEGLTEFLPVSSTAHLILIGKIATVNLTDPYVKFYLLFIQLGALVAGVMLFSKRILTDKSLIVNISASFLPTAVIGFTLYKLFKHLLEGNLILMAVVLAFGGVLLISIEKLIEQRAAIQDYGRDTITIKDAFLIGCAQAFAMVPGVSRSGATIIAGIFMNIRKAVIVEYTFLLALPTLGAAVLYDGYKSRDMLSNIASWNELLLGFLIAAITAFVTLIVLRKYLPTISLAWFGWYRIILATLILITLW